MSAASNDFHASTSSVFSLGLRALRLAVRALQNRQAALHLAAMSDFELKDIGLSRAEIGHAVRAGRADAKPVGARAAAPAVKAPMLRVVADQKGMAERQPFRLQRQLAMRPSLQSEVSRP